VPINHLMEDAATAEISRAQLWQWVRHGVVTVDRVMQILHEEVERIRRAIGPDRFAAGRFDEASRLFELMTRAPNCPEFLTSIAYEIL
jgi:malate synthase